MSENETTTNDAETAERWDAPNQQAVGQPPPWEQGDGGSRGEAKAAEQTEVEEPEEQPRRRRTTKKDDEEQ